MENPNMKVTAQVQVRLLKSTVIESHKTVLDLAFSAVHLLVQCVGTQEAKRLLLSRLGDYQHDYPGYRLDDKEADPVEEKPVTKVKITPGMRAWLMHLLRGRKIVRSATVGTTGPYYCDGKGGMTYVMAHKLEDAGLIRWESSAPIGQIQREQAVLTDAGNAAARGAEK